MKNETALPIAWVDRIFEKLNLIYGRAFIARWDDCGYPIEDVKADWAHELSGFKDHPDAISYALQHLPPDRPPTVLQFREIARKAPPKPLPRLPEPKADMARVKAELAKAWAVIGRKPNHGNVARMNET